jgi:hypothetical protein
MSYLSADLRDRLLEADDRHCAYCYTTEANTGQPMTVDHITPQAQGGETTFGNLCFACRRCNEFKGNTTSARDPLTSETTPLFHRPALPQTLTTPSATSTTCPPTRTAAISSPSLSTSTYSVLGRLISAPCSLTMVVVGSVTGIA